MRYALSTVTHVSRGWHGTTIAIAMGMLGCAMGMAAAGTMLRRYRSMRVLTVTEAQPVLMQQAHGPPEEALEKVETPQELTHSVGMKASVRKQIRCRFLSL
jgi:hypothetical protein